MKKLRTFAIVGALGIAGLGLVGLGAHAAFFTSTTSSQQVTAGTLSLGLTAPNSSCQAHDSFGSCTTLALPDYGPTQSTFDSGPQIVTATNNGDITASNILLSAANSADQTNAANSAFNNEAWVCVTGDQLNGTSVVLVNESLKDFEAANVPVSGTEAPQATAPYSVEFFAGTVSTLCGNGGYGAVTTTGQSTPETLAPAGGLDNTAEGGVINPAITIQYQG